MGVGNDVLKNERFFGVSQDALQRAFSGFLHGGVYFFHGHILLEHGHKVGQGTGRSRNAEGSAVQGPLQVRHYFTNGLGGAGGRRNDVDRGGAGTAGILVRKVQNALVVRVGVNRAHHALFNAELVVQHLHHRSKAVGGAGSVGNDIVLGRIVFAVVDAQNESQVRIRGGSGNKNLLGAGVKVLLGGVALGEQAGGFQNDVHAQILPGKVGGITFHGDEDLVTVNDQIITLDGNFTVKLALRGVILEQVGDRFDRSQVIDGNNLVAFFLGHGAQYVATNASKTVNSVFGHKIEGFRFD